MAIHRFRSSLSKVPEADSQVCSYRKWGIDLTIELLQLALKLLLRFSETPAKSRTTMLIELRTINAAKLKPLLAQQIAENH
jgi:hypothetical protein